MASVITLVAMTGTSGAGALDAPVQAYPPLGLPELSGMALSVRHEGVLWAVEDGAFDQSAAPVVRAFDQAGAQVAAVTLAGWNNRDIEALAIGPGPALWAADIGDNSLLRETVVVHTFPEPDALGEVTLEPVSYRLRYPDGPHDAETIMIDPVDGRLYLATKSIFGNGTLYAAPATLTPGATHDLEPVVDVPLLITDGSFTPDGGQVVLLQNRDVLGSQAILRDVVRTGPGEPVTLQPSDDPIELPSQEQPESLTITRDASHLLVGSEDPEGTGEPIWSVALPLAPTGSEPGPGVTSSPSTGSPDGEETVAPEETGCRISDPLACVDDPTERFSVVGVAMVAVLIGALAVLRSRRSGR